MSSKIYTKTGDKGQTSLIGGTKVPKNHLRIESYGTVDELNSWTGMLIDQLSDEHSRLVLREIQDRLFTIGSSLATDPLKEKKLALPDLHEEDIVLLEKEIDAMNEKLPVLRSFILPGGDIAISTAHVTRCVCRRAERLCVGMREEGMDGNELTIKYLNRLSDYFFILARFIAVQKGVEEIQWKPRKG
ncbi:MAG TPA: cob(I)yrinic acid a,c-diamide adenosyltransferase [Flavitalea sp.]|nr:cob(I)yrinic acid a,c-diamide adenosyltransferase [Flavitalea sp.]